MVAAQGGDPRAVDEPEAILPRAPVVVVIEADRDGTLAEIDAEELGSASAALGAGRARKGEPIDPAVGIVWRPEIGARLARGEPIGEVHARDRDAADAAAARVLAALTVGEGDVEPPPLVHDWMG
jgi:thymidine phosphorylase